MNRGGVVKSLAIFLICATLVIKTAKKIKYIYACQTFGDPSSC